MAKRLIPLGCIVLGVLLYWASSGAGNAQAYVFPKLLAATMIVIAIAMTIADWGVRVGQKDTPVAVPWSKLWPALMIFVLYMAAAQPLGFYLASWLAFATIGIVYSPSESTISTAKRCVPIAFAFLLVLYGVFVVLLRVQMPKGVML